MTRHFMSSTRFRILSYVNFTRWLNDRYHLHDAILRVVSCEHLSDGIDASTSCSVCGEGRRVLVEVLVPVDYKPDDYVKTSLLFDGVNYIRFSVQAADCTDAYIVRSLVKQNKDGSMTFGIYGELCENGEWHEVEILWLSCCSVRLNEPCLLDGNKKDGEGCGS